MLTQIAFLILGLALGLIGAWLLLRRHGTKPATDHLSALHQVLTERLEHLSAQLDRRLTESNQTMAETKSFLTDRVGSNERAIRESAAASDKTIREVTAKLGQLEQTTTHLKRSTEEIASFQSLLTSPKFRGGFGEVLLGNLLSDSLPQERYALQHRLPGTGEIADALILLQDGYTVAIDAKFPLANYELYAKAQDPELKKKQRKIFLADVKKHIKDIAKKYIAPEHKTLDYAFMYVPVEAIYYETMVHDHGGDPLWDFSLKHKVVPVSPNSFLAYLHTVLIGLRGLKIQEQAKEIAANLSQVRHDFTKFYTDYTTVGTHLTNASNKYHEATRRLDKVTGRLEQIETNTDVPKIEEGEQ